MAIILSTATGAWNDGTTWVGGIAPGINDIGSIEVGHVVTITSADQALGWKINGGHLVLNNNFTITDAPNCGIIISSDATSSFTSNATASTPRLLVSSSLNPTNPWSVVVYAMAGYDTRTLNFDYIEMRGNVWFLGYGPPGGGSYVGIQFNNPNLGNSGSWLQTVQPLGRDPILIEQPIDGRDYSRIYQRGNHAGAFIITGYMPLASFDYITTRLLQESKHRICLFTNFFHYPKIRFDSKPRFDPKPGLLIVHFSMTFIEDQ